MKNANHKEEIITDKKKLIAEIKNTKFSKKIIEENNWNYRQV